MGGPDSDVVILSGKNAYPCVLEEGRISCDEGVCNYGMHCKVKGECHYYKAVLRAKLAKIVVTNYAMWHAIHEYGEGLGAFEMLVMDEAHQAPEILASALSVVLYREDMEETSGEPPSKDDEVLPWVRWGEEQARQVGGRLEVLKERLKAGFASLNPALKREVKRLQLLSTKLGTLVEVGRLVDEWVIEEGTGDSNMPEATKGKARWRGGTPNHAFRLDPVWPGIAAERYLFRGTGRVLMTSATVNRKTVALLGVEGGELAYWECPNPFPKGRRPVYHVRTVRLNARSTEADLRQWVTRIDQILRARPGVKGIVHTTSYARKEFLLKHSREAGRMISHNSHNTLDRVREFKKCPDPLVLVSPSVVTGYDFPYEECRFQIIGKVPFPDTRNAILRVRCRRDPEYRNYLTSQSLVQAYGRGMRAADDWCECFILDDNIGWFLRHSRKLVAKWFMDAVEVSATIPARKEVGV